MHRVVCCYPDPDSLVGAAAEHARRFLLMSFPRESRLMRIGFEVANLWFRRVRFKVYVHLVSGVLAAERRGLRPVFEHRGRIWHLAALERA
jgi:hypothetical protein